MTTLPRALEVGEGSTEPVELTWDQQGLSLLVVQANHAAGARLTLRAYRRTAEYPAEAWTLADTFINTLAGDGELRASGRTVATWYPGGGLAPGEYRLVLAADVPDGAGGWDERRIPPTDNPAQALRLSIIANSYSQ